MDYFFGSPSKGTQKFCASIDQGTSSSRFMVFNRQGEVVGSSQKEHKQYFPQQGHVEHDPEEIWSCVKECITKVVDSEGLKPHNIASLGITNQRETTVVWNRHTGKPYHNAIVWNDSRTAAICEVAAQNDGRLI